MCTAHFNLILICIFTKFITSKLIDEIDLSFKNISQKQSYFENMKGFTMNSTQISNQINFLSETNFVSKIQMELDGLNNITGNFNCFYFNSDDFSVYDLSHLDKEEYLFFNLGYLILELIMILLSDLNYVQLETSKIYAIMLINLKLF